jgi:transposase
MKPIPTEMRKRILDDCDHGMTEKTAAAKWNVGRSTIANLKKQRRETGCIEPKKGKTGPKAKLREHRGLLKQIVTETPDATLEEIRERLPVQVSIQTVHVELKKLKLTYKKNNSTPPNNIDRTSQQNDRNGK